MALLKRNQSKIPALGDRLRDIVTGFEGVAVNKTEWLNGCMRFGVQSTKLKDDGTVSEIQYFDVEQLERVGEGINAKQFSPTGGDMPNPQRPNSPSR